MAALLYRLGNAAPPREAVIDGFRNSARVVTSAALIMTGVFSGFIVESDPDDDHQPITADAR